MESTIGIRDIGSFAEKLTNKQKEIFKYAAELAGFTNLAEFLIYSANEKAMQIVNAHSGILNCDKDKEIFFEALTNPPKPVKKLYDAANDYFSYVAEK